MCLPFGPTTWSTSSSMSSASTPSPTPTLSASSPSFAAPTSSPSASCTRAGNTSSTRPCSPTCSSAPSSTVPMRSSCPRGLGWRLSRSQRERTRRGGRHLNFYGLRDNLPVEGAEGEQEAPEQDQDGRAWSRFKRVFSRVPLSDVGEIASFDITDTSRRHWCRQRATQYREVADYLEAVADQHRPITDEDLRRLLG